jgi:hypothetical protein
MRAVLKICLQHLRYKCKYASPNYHINIRFINFSKHFKNVRWCFSNCLPPFTLLAWLAAYDAPASLGMSSLPFTGEHITSRYWGTHHFLLLREVFLDHSKLVSEILELDSGQGLGQHICYLFVSEQ